jgi:tRNA A37 threonylcarbamoyladenosine dehydratase
VTGLDPAAAATRQAALAPTIADEPGAAIADNAADSADLERRFGGLARLYGSAGYARLRAARVAVVGLGGVGSWAVEALARSGVASLVLIDLDHVAESNINRQVQATGSTLGMAKGEALRARINDIHPGCEVEFIDAFVAADNWPALLTRPVDALFDACDQSGAKLALAAWARRSGTLFISSGAAGGKRQADQVEIADLAEVSHDPLLASLRRSLRKSGAAPAKGAIGVRCVFSRESVAPPVAACSNDGGSEGGNDGSLNCAGFGSSVAVTATFGFCAAGELMRMIAAQNVSLLPSASNAML